MVERKKKSWNSKEKSLVPLVSWACFQQNDYAISTKPGNSCLAVLKLSKCIEILKPAQKCNTQRNPSFPFIYLDVTYVWQPGRIFVLLVDNIANHFSCFLKT